MRRIARLQTPLRLGEAVVFRPTTATATAATTAPCLVHRPRHYSSSQPLSWTRQQRLFSTTQLRGKDQQKPPAVETATATETSEAKAPTEQAPEAAAPTSSTATVEADVAYEKALDEFVEGTGADREALLSDDPKLVVPGAYENAPRPGRVEDRSYEPAETGDGLEEVGGLQDWWEDDEHWDAAVEIRGFAPSHHATDAAVLQVLARRAVLEAAAVQSVAAVVPDAVKLTDAWGSNAADNKAARDQALGLHVVVDSNGHVTDVQGNVDAVVASLAEDVSSASSSDVEAATPLESEEAEQLLQSWDDSWKNVSLADPAFKFAITKRILQLTGHILPDAKLVGVDTVAGLLSVLVEPPKAAKLAETLAENDSLQTLPNVSLYQRRVTSIDKHKMVGRWKVIVEELEKRDLPVTGTGKYGKPVERKWLYG